MGQSVCKCCNCTSSADAKRHSSTKVYPQKPLKVDCVWTQGSSLPSSIYRHHTFRSSHDSDFHSLETSMGEDSNSLLKTSREDFGPTGEVTTEIFNGGDISDLPVFVRKLRDVTIKVGTSLKIAVEITSNTDFVVTWYRNDNQIVANDDYKIVHEGNIYAIDIACVNVQDNGRWTCSAESYKGRITSSCYLHVNVPKSYKKPVFYEELEAVLTDEGTVSLQCKVVGVPTPVLRWFKDGREIKAGDIFALVASSRDPVNLGVYTCEASNCMGKAYSSSRVKVNSKLSLSPRVQEVISVAPSGQPPIFTQELKDENVKVGESFILSCQIAVPPWPKSIKWQNPQEKYVDVSEERYRDLADGLGGYMLEIISSEECDRGTWKCVAVSGDNSVAMSSCNVQIWVPKTYRKPYFVEKLKAVLTEDGLVSFECKVVGYPTPHLRWFKDGSELRAGDIYQLTGISSLGSYVCIAKNCMGEARSEAELTVDDIKQQLSHEETMLLSSIRQPPKFLKKLMSSEASINSPFKFTVQVKTPPNPKLLWYRDDHLIELNEKKYSQKIEPNGVFHLNISKLEFEDQAEWKCVASNEFGRSECSAFLKLIIPKHYKKPKFLENLRAILTESGIVNLECKVIGVPQPTLIWYKDGVELNPGDIHKIMSGQDGTCCLGVYTCEARNCMGSVTSSASVHGIEDAAPPHIKPKIRKLSLSTINEEDTFKTADEEQSLVNDQPHEISYSFDGKEISVSYYDTPDITQEEAIQIVEMYADQLSEHISEHNVLELPPLRIVKETSTASNILMEGVVIDIQPEYFTVEEDLRTEAGIEDISVIEDTLFSSRQSNKFSLETDSSKNTKDKYSDIKSTSDSTIQSPEMYYSLSESKKDFSLPISPRSRQSMELETESYISAMSYGTDQAAGKSAKVYLQDSPDRSTSTVETNLAEQKVDDLTDDNSVLRHNTQFITVLLTNNLTDIQQRLCYMEKEIYLKSMKQHSKTPDILFKDTSNLIQSIQKLREFFLNFKQTKNGNSINVTFLDLCNIIQKLQTNIYDIHKSVGNDLNEAVQKNSIQIVYQVGETLVNVLDLIADILKLDTFELCRSNVTQSEKQRLLNLILDTRNILNDLVIETQDLVVDIQENIMAEEMQKHRDDERMLEERISSESQKKKDEQKREIIEKQLVELEIGRDNQREEIMEKIYTYQEDKINDILFDLDLVKPLFATISELRISEINYSEIFENNTVKNLLFSILDIEKEIIQSELQQIRLIELDETDYSKISQYEDEKIALKFKLTKINEQQNILSRMPQILKKDLRSKEMIQNILSLEWLEQKENELKQYLSTVIRRKHNLSQGTKKDEKTVVKEEKAAVKEEKPSVSQEKILPKEEETKKVAVEDTTEKQEITKKLEYEPTPESQQEIIEYKLIDSNNLKEYFSQLTQAEKKELVKDLTSHHNDKSYYDHLKMEEEQLVTEVKEKIAKKSSMKNKTRISIAERQISNLKNTLCATQLKRLTLEKMLETDIQNQNLEDFCFGIISDILNVSREKEILLRYETEKPKEIKEPEVDKQKQLENIVKMKKQLVQIPDNEKLVIIKELKSNYNNASFIEQLKSEEKQLSTQIRQLETSPTKSPQTEQEKSQLESNLIRTLIKKSILNIFTETFKSKHKPEELSREIFSNLPFILEEKENLIKSELKTEIINLKKMKEYLAQISETDKSEMVQELSSNYKNKNFITQLVEEEKRLHDAIENLRPTIKVDKNQEKDVSQLEPKLLKVQTEKLILTELTDVLQSQSDLNEEVENIFANALSQLPLVLEEKENVIKTTIQEDTLMDSTSVKITREEILEKPEQLEAIKGTESRQEIIKHPLKEELITIEKLKQHLETIPGPQKAELVKELSSKCQEKNYITELIEKEGELQSKIEKFQSIPTRLETATESTTQEKSTLESDLVKTHIKILALGKLTEIFDETKKVEDLFEDALLCLPDMLSEKEELLKAQINKIEVHTDSLPSQNIINEAKQKVQETKIQEKLTKKEKEVKSVEMPKLHDIPKLKEHITSVLESDKDEILKELQSNYKNANFMNCLVTEEEKLHNQLKATETEIQQLTSVSRLTFEQTSRIPEKEINLEKVSVLKEKQTNLEKSLYKTQIKILALAEISEISIANSTIENKLENILTNISKILEQKESLITRKEDQVLSHAKPVEDILVQEATVTKQEKTKEEIQKKELSNIKKLKQYVATISEAEKADMIKELVVSCKQENALSELIAEEATLNAEFEELTDKPVTQPSLEKAYVSEQENMLEQKLLKAQLKKLVMERVTEIDDQTNPEKVIRNTLISLPTILEEKEKSIIKEIPVEIAKKIDTVTLQKPQIAEIIERITFGSEDELKTIDNLQTQLTTMSESKKMEIAKDLSGNRKNDSFLEELKSEEVKLKEEIKQIKLEKLQSVSISEVPVEKTEERSETCYDKAKVLEEKLSTLESNLSQVQIKMMAIAKVSHLPDTKKEEVEDLFMDALLTLPNELEEQKQVIKKAKVSETLIHVDSSSEKARVSEQKVDTVILEKRKVGEILTKITSDAEDKLKTIDNLQTQLKSMSKTEKMNVAKDLSTSWKNESFLEELASQEVKLKEEIKHAVMEKLHPKSVSEATLEYIEEQSQTYYDKAKVLEEKLSTLESNLSQVQIKMMAVAKVSQLQDTKKEEVEDLFMDALLTLPNELEEQKEIIKKAKVSETLNRVDSGKQLAEISEEKTDTTTLQKPKTPEILREVNDNQQIESEEMKEKELENIKKLKQYAATVSEAEKAEMVQELVATCNQENALSNLIVEERTLNTELQLLNQGIASEVTLEELRDTPVIKPNLEKASVTEQENLLEQKLLKTQIKKLVLEQITEINDKSNPESLVKNTLLNLPTILEEKEKSIIKEIPIEAAKKIDIITLQKPQVAEILEKITSGSEDELKTIDNLQIQLSTMPKTEKMEIAKDLSGNWKKATLFEKLESEQAKLKKEIEQTKLQKLQSESVSEITLEQTGELSQISYDKAKVLEEKLSTLESSLSQVQIKMMAVAKVSQLPDTRKEEVEDLFMDALLTLPNELEEQKEIIKKAKVSKTLIHVDSSSEKEVVSEQEVDIATLKEPQTPEVLKQIIYDQQIESSAEEMKQKELANIKKLKQYAATVSEVEKAEIVQELLVTCKQGNALSELISEETMLNAELASLELLNQGIISEIPLEELSDKSIAKPGLEKAQITQQENLLEQKLLKTQIKKLVIEQITETGDQTNPEKLKNTLLVLPTILEEKEKNIIKEIPVEAAKKFDIVTLQKPKVAEILEKITLDQEDKLKTIENVQTQLTSMPQNEKIDVAKDLSNNWKNESFLKELMTEEAKLKREIKQIKSENIQPEVPLEQTEEISQIHYDKAKISEEKLSVLESNLLQVQIKIMAIAKVSQLQETSDEVEDLFMDALLTLPDELEEEKPIIGKSKVSETLVHIDTDSKLEKGEIRETKIDDANLKKPQIAEITEKTTYDQQIESTSVEEEMTQRELAKIQKLKKYTANISEPKKAEMVQELLITCQQQNAISGLIAEEAILKAELEDLQLLNQGLTSEISLEEVSDKQIVQPSSEKVQITKQEKLLEEKLIITQIKKLVLEEITDAVDQTNPESAVKNALSRLPSILGEREKIILKQIPMVAAKKINTVTLQKPKVAEIIEKITSDQEDGLKEINNIQTQLTSMPKTEKMEIVKDLSENWKNDSFLEELTSKEAELKKKIKQIKLEKLQSESISEVTLEQVEELSQNRYDKANVLEEKLLTLESNLSQVQIKMMAIAKVSQLHDTSEKVEDLFMDALLTLPNELEEQKQIIKKAKVSEVLVHVDTDSKVAEEKNKLVDTEVSKASKLDELKTTQATEPKPLKIEQYTDSALSPIASEAESLSIKDDQTHALEYEILEDQSKTEADKAEVQVLCLASESPLTQPDMVEVLPSDSIKISHPEQPNIKLEEGGKLGIITSELQINETVAKMDSRTTSPELVDVTEVLEVQDKVEISQTKVIKDEKKEENGDVKPEKAISELATEETVAKEDSKTITPELAKVSKMEQIKEEAKISKTEVIKDEKEKEIAEVKLECVTSELVTEESVATIDSKMVSPELAKVTEEERMQDTVKVSKTDTVKDEKKKEAGDAKIEKAISELETEETVTTTDSKMASLKSAKVTEEKQAQDMAKFQKIEVLTDETKLVRDSQTEQIDTKIQEGATSELEIKETVSKLDSKTTTPEFARVSETEQVQNEVKVNQTEVVKDEYKKEVTESKEIIEIIKEKELKPVDTKAEDVKVEKEILLSKEITISEEEIKEAVTAIDSKIASTELATMSEVENVQDKAKVSKTEVITDEIKKEVDKSKKDKETKEIQPEKDAEVEKATQLGKEITISKETKETVAMMDSKISDLQSASVSEVKEAQGKVEVCQPEVITDENKKVDEINLNIMHASFSSVKEVEIVEDLLTQMKDKEQTVVATLLDSKEKELKDELDKVKAIRILTDQNIQQISMETTSALTSEDITEKQQKVVELQEKENILEKDVLILQIQKLALAKLEKLELHDASHLKQDIQEAVASILEEQHEKNMVTIQEATVKVAETIPEEKEIKSEKSVVEKIEENLEKQHLVKEEIASEEQSVQEKLKSEEDKETKDKKELKKKTLKLLEHSFESEDVTTEAAQELTITSPKKETCANEVKVADEKTQSEIKPKPQILCLGVQSPLESETATEIKTDQLKDKAEEDYKQNVTIQPIEQINIALDNVKPAEGDYVKNFEPEQISYEKINITQEEILSAKIVDVDIKENKDVLTQSESKVTEKTSLEAAILETKKEQEVIQEQPEIQKEKIDKTESEKQDQDAKKIKTIKKERKDSKEISEDIESKQAEKLETKDEKEEKNKEKKKKIEKIKEEENQDKKIHANVKEENEKVEKITEKIKETEKEQIEKKETEKVVEKEPEKKEKKEQEKLDKKGTEREGKEPETREKKTPEKIEKKEQEKIEKKEIEKVEKKESEKVEKKKTEKIEKKEPQKRETMTPEKTEKKEQEKIEKKETEKLEKKETEKVEKKETEKMEKKEPKKRETKAPEKTEKKEQEKVEKKETEKVEKKEIEKREKKETEKIEKKETEKIEKKETEKMEKKEAEKAENKEPKKRETKTPEKTEKKEQEKIEKKETEKVEKKETEKLEKKETEKVEKKEPEKRETKTPEKTEKKEKEKIEEKETEKVEKKKAESRDKKTPEKKEKKEQEKLEKKETETEPEKREKITPEKIEKKEQEKIETEKVEKKETAKIEKEEPEKREEKTPEKVEKKEQEKVEKKETEKVEKKEKEKVEKKEPESRDKKTPEKKEKKEQKKLEKKGTETESEKREKKTPEKIEKKEQEKIETEKVEKKETAKIEKEEPEKKEEKTPEKAEKKEQEKEEKKETEKVEKKETEKVEKKETEKVEKKESEKREKKTLEKKEKKEQEKIEKKETEKVERREPEKREKKTPEKIEKKETEKVEKKESVKIEQKELEETEKKETKKIEKKEPEKREKKSPEKIEKKVSEKTDKEDIKEVVKEKSEEKQLIKRRKASKNGAQITEIKKTTEDDKTEKVKQQQKTITTEITKDQKLEINEEHRRKIQENQVKEKKDETTEIKLQKEIRKQEEESYQKIEKRIKDTKQKEEDSKKIKNETISVEQRDKRTQEISMKEEKEISYRKDKSFEGKRVQREIHELTDKSEKLLERSKKQELTRDAALSDKIQRTDRIIEEHKLAIRKERARSDYLSCEKEKRISSYSKDLTELPRVSEHRVKPISAIAYPQTMSPIPKKTIDSQQSYRRSTHDYYKDRDVLKQEKYSISGMPSLSKHKYLDSPSYTHISVPESMHINTRKSVIPKTKHLYSSTTESLLRDDVKETHDRIRNLIRSSKDIADSLSAMSSRYHYLQKYEYEPFSRDTMKLSRYSTYTPYQTSRILYRNKLEMLTHMDYQDYYKHYFKLPIAYAVYKSNLDRSYLYPRRYEVTLYYGLLRTQNTIVRGYKHFDYGTAISKIVKRESVQQVDMHAIRFNCSESCHACKECPHRTNVASLVTRGKLVLGHKGFVDTRPIISQKRSVTWESPDYEKYAKDNLTKAITTKDRTDFAIVQVTPRKPLAEQRKDIHAAFMSALETGEKYQSLPHSSRIQKATPAFVLRPDSLISVAPGQDIVISFKISDESSTRISLTKRFMDITKNPRFRSEQFGNLVRYIITNANYDDMGTYCLSVENNYGSSRSFITVTVDNNVKNTTYYRLLKDQMLPTVRSTSIPTRSKLQDVQSSSLSYRSCSPSPSYNISPPVFYTLPHNIVTELGETVRFQVTVGGFPSPWVTWLKNGIIVLSNGKTRIIEKFNTKILEIACVSGEDVGTYTIIIQNEAGRALSTARLDLIQLRKRPYQSRFRY